VRRQHCLLDASLLLTALPPKHYTVSTFSCWQSSMLRLAKLIKQPLLHFVVLGCLLFLFYKPTAETAAPVSAAIVNNEIVVDKTALLNYMQYQAKAFNAELFTQKLAAMPAAEKELLIKDYVREEALYREALKLHMEEGDYIIKQRLVQKVEFLLENLVSDSINPTEAQLTQFYNARLADYRVDEVYSFTHIFFDADKSGKAAALARAQAQLSKKPSLAFSDAAQYGDRFPFLQNYVERTRDFVSNNFSDDFVQQLDKLLPSESVWHGPLESRYGYHVVMLINRKAASTPALADIRQRVLEDYRYEALQQNREQAEQTVVAGYHVNVQLESAQ
jgi:hypothetical protein